MRAENGFVESKVIWGSPDVDYLFDVEVNQNGLYFIAQMGDRFLPHRNNDKAWGGQNGKLSWVLAWIDWHDLILEMEGYAIDEMVSPFPTKFFVSRKEDHDQIY